MDRSALAVASLALVACSGPRPQEPATTPAQAPAAAPEPDGPPAPTTVLGAHMRAAGCERVGYRAPAGARPELRHRLRGPVLELGLHNAGTAPVCMFTHVATHELQSDWHRLEIVDGGERRTISFFGDRDKSAAVSEEIGPGETRWIGFDVVAWAGRAPGGRPLASGEVQATAIYDSTHSERAWSGRLERPFVLRVP